MIILGDTPVQFFYTGLLRKEGLRDVKDLMNFNLTNDISVIQTPSEVIAERAKEMYSIFNEIKVFIVVYILLYTVKYKISQLKIYNIHNLVFIKSFNITFLTSLTFTLEMLKS